MPVVGVEAFWAPDSIAAGVGGDDVVRGHYECSSAGRYFEFSPVFARWPDFAAGVAVIVATAPLCDGDGLTG